MGIFNSMWKSTINNVVAIRNYGNLMVSLVQPSFAKSKCLQRLPTVKNPDVFFINQ